MSSDPAAQVKEVAGKDDIGGPFDVSKLRVAPPTPPKQSADPHTYGVSWNEVVNVETPDGNVPPKVASKGRHAEQFWKKCDLINQVMIEVEDAFVVAGDTRPCDKLLLQIAQISEDHDGPTKSVKPESKHEKVVKAAAECGEFAMPGGIYSKFQRQHPKGSQEYVDYMMQDLDAKKAYRQDWAKHLQTRCGWS